MEMKREVTFEVKQFSSKFFSNPANNPAIAFLANLAIYWLKKHIRSYFHTIIEQGVNDFRIV